MNPGLAISCLRAESDKNCSDGLFISTAPIVAALVTNCSLASGRLRSAGFTRPASLPEASRPLKISSGVLPSIRVLTVSGIVDKKELGSSTPVKEPWSSRMWPKRSCWVTSSLRPFPASISVVEKSTPVRLAKVVMSPAATAPATIACRSPSLPCVTAVEIATESSSRSIGDPLAFSNVVSRLSMFAILSCVDFHWSSEIFGGRDRATLSWPH